MNERTLNRLKTQLKLLRSELSLREKTKNAAIKGHARTLKKLKLLEDRIWRTL